MKAVQLKFESSAAVQAVQIRQRSRFAVGADERLQLSEKAAS